MPQSQISVNILTFAICTEVDFRLLWIYLVYRICLLLSTDIVLSGILHYYKRPLGKEYSKFEDVLRPYYSKERIKTKIRNFHVHMFFVWIVIGYHSCHVHFADHCFIQNRVIHLTNNLSSFILQLIIYQWFSVTKIFISNNRGIALCIPLYILFCDLMTLIPYTYFFRRRNPIGGRKLLDRDKRGATTQYTTRQ